MVEKAGRTNTLDSSEMGLVVGIQKLRLPEIPLIQKYPRPESLLSHW